MLNITDASKNRGKLVCITRSCTSGQRWIIGLNIQPRIAAVITDPTITFRRRRQNETASPIPGRLICRIPSLPSAERGPRCLARGGRRLIP